MERCTVICCDRHTAQRSYIRWLFVDASTTHMPSHHSQIAAYTYSTIHSESESLTVLRVSCFLWCVSNPLIWFSLLNFAINNWHRFDETHWWEAIVLYQNTAWYRSWVDIVCIGCIHRYSAENSIAPLLHGHILAVDQLWNCGNIGHFFVRVHAHTCQAQAMTRWYFSVELIQCQEHCEPLPITRMSELAFLTFIRVAST
jgi:hypothetical protein